MSWARGFAEVSLPRLGTSRCDRSRGSFAPTHSARTPLVAARGERRLELPASRRAPSGVSLHERAWRRSGPCERDLRLPRCPLPCGRGSVGQGRLTRTPAKGNTIRCTRGAFHRRIAPAGARLALPKLSPACGVTRLAPFSFLPPPGPLTRLRGARGLDRALSATGFKSRARHRYDRSASRRLLRSVRSAA